MGSSWVEDFGLADAYRSASMSMASEIRALRAQLHHERGIAKDVRSTALPPDAAAGVTLSNVVPATLRGLKRTLRQVVQPAVGPESNHPKMERDVDCHRPRYLVSIVVTLFNQGQEALAGLVALLNQTFRDFELILVDDGSSKEETEFLISAVIDRFVGRSVQLIRQENAGVCSARNAGLNAATGKYVGFFDPGDSWSVTYLEKAVALLEQYWDVHVVYPYVKTVGDRNGYWAPEGATEEILALRNSVPICALVRKSAALGVGGFDPRMKEGFEDWEFWYRIARRGGKFRVIPEPLFRYQFGDLAGRDASARRISKELHDRIIGLNRSGNNELDSIEVGDYEAELLQLSRSLPSGPKGVVVFVLPWLVEHGGADVYARSLIKWLSSEGFTVVVVSTEAVATPRHFDIYAEVTPYVYQLQLLAEMHRPSFFRNLLKVTNNPLVVNFGSPWLYRNSWQGFSEFTSNAFDVQFNHVGHLGELAFASSYFSAVVCASRGLSSIVQSLCLVDETRTEVRTIYVGIEAAGESTPRTRSTAEVPRVGWVGRFSEEKNPRFYCEMARKAGGLRWIMLGEGTLRPTLEREFRDAVEFRDSKNSVSSFLSELDILVLTSDVEGIPLVALEALSAAIPVVSRSAGAIQELADVADGSVVLVEKNSRPAEMAQCILDTLDARDLRSPPELPDVMSWDGCRKEWSSLLVSKGYLV